MPKNLTISLLAFVMMLIITALFGCGASNPSSANLFPGMPTTGGNNTTAAFGSLALSGTNLIGISFVPASTSVASIPLTTQTFYYWFDTTSSQTFPQNRLTISTDSAAGGVTAIGIANYATSGSAPGPAWAIASTALAPISAASISFSTASRSVTFNNLTLPSIASTTALLTLNGTLTY